MPETVIRFACQFIRVLNKKNPIKFISYNLSLTAIRCYLDRFVFISFFDKLTYGFSLKT